MNIVQVIMGVVMLIFGRKLFWLLVGMAGFLAGSRLGVLVFVGQPQWLVFLLAAAIGLIGIVVAIFFQRVAFAAAGFFTGAYLTATAAAAIGILPESVALLVGGVLGAIIAAMIMDWAIVWLSCLTGAGAVVSAIGASPGLQLGLWIALSMVGFFFQARSLQGQKIHDPER